MELNLRFLLQSSLFSLCSQKAKKLEKRLGIVGVTLLLVLTTSSALAVHGQPGQVLQGGVATPPVNSLTPHATSLVSTLAVVPIRTTSTAITNCTENNAGKLLIVSISQQHIWACNGMQTVNDSAVTTGANDMPRGVDDSTPTGTFHIHSKVTNTTLRGCDINGCWNDRVQYWMPFDGEVGFHDASWQTFPFGGSEYHTNGSHGCVHLPTSMAAWVYGWAPVGTEVVIET